MPLLETPLCQSQASLDLHTLAPSGAPLADEADKLVNDARPRRVLAPEPQTGILKRLLRKHKRLVPQVLVDGLAVALGEEVQPPLQPRRVRARPGQRRRREQHAPVLGRRFEGEALLALGAGDEEGVAVDVAQDLRVGGQGGGAGGDQGCYALDVCYAGRLSAEMAL